MTEVMDAAVMDGTTLQGYEKLQKVLDQVVGRIGLKSTIALLSGCIGERKSSDEMAKTRALPSFILSKVIDIYQTDEKTIYGGNTREFTDARKICYHLCAKYTAYSRSKIGLLYGGASKRKVQDSISKAEEMLSMPRFHKMFCLNYQEAEKAVVDFLTKC